MIRQTGSNHKENGLATPGMTAHIKTTQPDRAGELLKQHEYETDKSRFSLERSNDRQETTLLGNFRKLFFSGQPGASETSPGKQDTMQKRNANLNDDGPAADVWQLLVPDANKQQAFGGYAMMVHKKYGTAIELSRSGSGLLLSTVDPVPVAEWQPGERLQKDQIWRWQVFAHLLECICTMFAQTSRKKMNIC